ncbi:MAG: ATP-grasp domain-containing protein [Sedimentisphaerales bacterium]|nr:ATP-grasp domain-containing protein [Sedimentisphaerales bacterium]
MAIKKLGMIPRLIGTEMNPLSPALQHCDKRYLVHPVQHTKYVSDLLSIVHREKVNLIIPTVDLDLRNLAIHQQDFTRLGCRVLISQPEVIDICQDKRKTCRFLQRHGFLTAKTWTLSTALKKRLRYPLFLKPWDGYASRGNAIVRNKEELRFHGRRIPNCIVQEYIKGTEYTCDVFVDFSMHVRCIVPRKRIEVRSGEVSKAQTIKQETIMSEVRRLVEILGAGPGVITVQLIEKKGKLYFIEINPRFGGGAPLSIKAGADFPKWIIHQYLGKKAVIRFDGWKENLFMLRYDNEVWLTDTDVSMYHDLR